MLLILSFGCGSEEPALDRGDRLWAAEDYPGALAEYRLALAQNETEETLGRTAHAYIMNGQFERARELYDRLVERSPRWTDQAVFDYVTAARRAQERANRYGMAVAVEAALALRPGLPVDDMAAPLARYYATTGDTDRALDFFERALTYARDDSVPPLLFELGELHEARGDCEEATGFFSAYRARAPRGPRVDDARWHIGNCAWRLGRAERQAGREEAALRHFDTLINLGVPQNLLDEAWFERGEVLLALGHRQEALQAYYQVLDLNRTGAGQLADRAQRRIDEIRFGRTFNP
jgi:tetratricopeptide (TPR) repeat protein